MADRNLEQFHRIAILGGTFNPVHVGHVEIARTILNARPDIEQLVCMPNHIPAYKDAAMVVDGTKRLAMLQLAMAQLPKVMVSDFELQRTGYTYTADTLTRLRQKYPNLQIEFVIGDDSLFQLHSWHEFERLGELCSILVVAREEQREKIEDYICKFCERYSTFSISYIEMKRIPVSSSEIRKRIANGMSVEGLLPEAVRNYVEAHALYKR